MGQDDLPRSGARGVTIQPTYEWLLAEPGD